MSDDETEILLATITVTKTLTDDDVAVYVDWSQPDGSPVPTVDAVGMLEMAKNTILNWWLAIEITDDEDDE